MNASQAQRARMGKLELAERVIEAALEQEHPSPELQETVQKYLTFTKHRLRDRTRERAS